MDDPRETEPRAPTADAELDARLRAAVEAARMAPGLDRLQNAVQAAAEDAKLRTGGGRKPAPRWLGMPALLAASISCLLLGGVGGFSIADVRAAAQAKALAELQRQERVAFQLAMNEALETLVSGKQVTFVNPETGLLDVITPLRTYQAKNGQWCREYAYETTREGLRETNNAVACRTGEGEWQTRLKMV
ncbi:MAG: hypothetical protein ACPGO3_14500 [Magnetospiraceae bacterium]